MPKSNNHSSVEVVNPSEGLKINIDRQEKVSSEGTSLTWSRKKEIGKFTRVSEK